MAMPQMQGQPQSADPMAEMMSMMDAMMQQMVAMKAKMQAMMGAETAEPNETQSPDQQMAAGYAKAKGPQLGM